MCRQGGERGKIAYLAAILLMACAGVALPGRGWADPAVTGRITDVPDDIRQAVMDRLQHDFVYPDLVLWHFTFMQPYPTGGIAICGELNLADSTRRYVGMQPFYARYVGGRVLDAGIVASKRNEDPVLSNHTAFQIACSPQ